MSLDDDFVDRSDSAIIKKDLIEYNKSMEMQKAVDDAYDIKVNKTGIAKLRVKLALVLFPMWSIIFIPTWIYMGPQDNVLLYILPPLFVAAAMSFYQVNYLVLDPNFVNLRDVYNAKKGMFILFIFLYVAVTVCIYFLFLILFGRQPFLSQLALFSSPWVTMLLWSYLNTF